MTEYDQQCENFLSKTNTTITKKFLKYAPYFDKKEQPRNIREITLSNREGSYTFTFGDSIIDSAKYTYKLGASKFISFVNRYNSGYGKEIKNIKHNKEHRDQMLKMYGKFLFNINTENLIEIEPSDYSILASLNLIHEDSFEEFCHSFGYDTDSRSAEKIYNSCVEQDRNLRRLYDRKELEMLQEIC